MLRSMKRFLSVAIAICCFSQYIYSQAQGENAVSHNGNSYDVFVIPFDSTMVSRFQFMTNDARLDYAAFVKDFDSKNGPNFFAINGGKCDSSFRPMGLFASDAKEKGSVDLGTGTGNFYMMPNGVFLITKTDVVVTESANRANYKDVVHGTQSGPMLLINGKYHPDFKQGSPNKRVRCGVGVFTDKGQKSILFVISNNDVNFYDFASFFKEKYKCDNALCLESAGANMNIPFLDRTNKMDNNVMCSYIIYKE